MFSSYCINTCSVVIFPNTFDKCILQTDSVVSKKVLSQRSSAGFIDRYGYDLEKNCLFIYLLLESGGPKSQCSGLWVE